MTVRVSFNPEVVARLAARGITARQDAPPSASRPTPGGGFVLARGSGPRAQGANTHVVSVRGHVVVTGRQARTAATPALAAPAVAISVERSNSRVSSELVAECDRLRRDNQRLIGEVTRLRAEVARLTSRFDETRGREAADLDDAATRFSLLELDL